MKPRAWILALLLLGLAPACTAAPCPVDLADAGCVTAPACADAGEGLTCERDGTSCQLCEGGTYHSSTARCERAGDGGLAWVISRGIPPMGCPPQ